jgi:hypothetical protein
MAFRFLDHETYVEVRLYDVVDEAGFAQRRARSQRIRPPFGTRVLLDLTDVERVAIPVDRLTAGMARVEALGVRMAIVAPRADLFGLARQVLQLAGVPEGFMISAFKERQLAVAWLLDSSFPSAEAMSGSGSLLAEEVLRRAFLD